AEIEIDSLDKATRISISTPINIKDLEARQNIDRFQEQLVDEEIKKLMEGVKNVDIGRVSWRCFNKEKKREWKGIKDIGDTPPPTPIIRYGYMFIYIKRTFMPSKEFRDMASGLKSTMKQVLPSIVDERVNEIAKNTMTLYVSKGLLLDRDHEDHHDDDARHEEESSAKRQKTSEYGTYFVGESSSEQVMDEEPNPSCSYTLEKLVEFDAWMDVFGTDDDEVPTKEVSPKLLEEISGEIDESQLQKVIDEMLRQQCNLGEEHQCQRDPKAPPITLLNQNLFYLKHGSSGPKKYTLSLDKYHAVPFLENDIDELTTRWVSKCIRRFNFYAQHSVENWKNLWVKKHYIRRQEKQRDKPEEAYSESKIMKVVRNLYELDHEHKFITKIVVRRANGKFDAIIESDYKHLNKNDIDDLYLMCINGMESYQQKVNLTAPTITFPGNERNKLLTITSKPVVGLIYENNMKDKWVMILKKIPKFCDATLKWVLEMVKKFNKDVKYVYADPSPSDANA
nr:hypothetical protein [Tanacetum cinerariifolium]